MCVLDLWCIMACGSGKFVQVCLRRIPNRALRPRRLRRTELCSILPASAPRLVRLAIFDRPVGTFDRPLRREEEHRIRPAPRQHPCKQGPAASRSKKHPGRPRRRREAQEVRLRQRSDLKAQQIRADPRHLRPQEAHRHRRRNHPPAQFRQGIRTPPQAPRLPKPMHLLRARRQPQRRRQRPRRFGRRLHRPPPAGRLGPACPTLPLHRLAPHLAPWMLASSRACSSEQNMTSTCKTCFSLHVPTNYPSRHSPNSMPSLHP